MEVTIASDHFFIDGLPWWIVFLWVNRNGILKS